jgi:hypothetical protein
MKKLVSIALCSFAAAAFGLPALAADETTAKNRAGANASVEGGAALGGTGVQSRAGGTAKQETTDSQPRTGDNAGAGARTGDAQARRDNNDDSAKPKDRAQTKKERDASTGTTGKTY